jgi:protein-disulfide isomerase
VKTLLITLFTAVLLTTSLTGWAASTKEEVIALREEVEAMRKDLDEIKKLLQQGARAPAARQADGGFRPQTINIAHSPIKGNMDAPVTLIEYSDYECPFCARNYRDVLPLIAEEYIETGKVRFVMRENPLTNIHRNAMNASMAALCAGDQGKYWEMHDLLFENSKQLGMDNLKAFAENIGLDTGQYNECLESKKHQATVQKDLASATKLGLRGTPAFVLGLTDADDPDKVDLSVSIRGAQGIERFRASIDDLLESAE